MPLAPATWEAVGRSMSWSQADLYSKFPDTQDTHVVRACLKKKKEKVNFQEQHSLKHTRFDLHGLGYKT